MGYRDATVTRRPPDTVFYRPMNLAASIALAFLIVGLSLMTLFQAVVAFRASHLTCERGGRHACVLVRDYAIVSTESIYPLDQIRAVQVKTHSGKSTSYSVGFVMRDGRYEQLSRAGRSADANLTRTVINDFLIGRSTNPTKIPIDEHAWWLALLMGVFSIGIGAISTLLFGSATVVIDRDRGTLQFTRRRFPLRNLQRTLRLDEVKSARVTARPGSKGGTIWGVSIDLVNGEEIPLVPNGGSGQSRSDEAANRINALLEKARED